jgi:hypothetical protein
MRVRDALALSLRRSTREPTLSQTSLCSRTRALLDRCRLSTEPNTWRLRLQVDDQTTAADCEADQRVSQGNNRCGPKKKKRDHCANAHVSARFCRDFTRSATTDEVPDKNRVRSVHEEKNGRRKGDARRECKKLMEGYPELNIRKVDDALPFGEDTMKRIVAGLREAGLPE